MAGEPTPRLCDRAVEVLRARHYSRRTEQPYIRWIRRLILFQAPTHPPELADGDVNRVLTNLAIHRNVTGSTQNQPLAALLFVYEKVLEQPLDRLRKPVSP